MATEANCRDWTQSTTAYDAGNVLTGNNTIFDFATLATYSANAVAVANTALDPVVITAGVEKTIPEAMADGYAGSPAAACALADFIFMKSDIISPYDLMADIGGETEVVVTFPTRLACHNSEADDMFNCIESAAADGDSVCDEWCVPIGITVWDDNEHRLDISDFSPSIGRCLAHEVNVVKLGGSQIWNSTVANTLTVGSFDLGWVDFDLAAGEPSHSSLFGGFASIGLPAIALTTQSFVGGAASYMLPAAYKTSVEQAP
jgi:hypothetical protein